MVVLITGANRGLGYEFARQLADKGYEVIATARDPGKAEKLHGLNVRIEALDVTDKDSIDAMKQRLGNVPIDILINNSGIKGHGPASFMDMDFRELVQTLDVNTLGPMRVVYALYPNLMQGSGRKIVQISSQLGSIGLSNGGAYDYRISKAALNMFSKTLAMELGSSGFTCVALRPGWVRTDMGGPAANLSPEESVGGMIEVIESLTPGDNGRFIGYDGNDVPW